MDKIKVLLFTTSTSSRGSFHRNLYLLDVSMTLAAEYLKDKQKKPSSSTAGGSVVQKPCNDCVCAYRLIELRLNEPDFLFRVVQMIRSLKRKSERSFFPPTVFCRETGAAQKIWTSLS